MGKLVELLGLQSLSQNYWKEQFAGDQMSNRKAGFDYHAAMNEAFRIITLKSLSKTARIELLAWAWIARQKIRFVEGARWQHEQSEKLHQQELAAARHELNVKWDRLEAAEKLIEELEEKLMDQCWYDALQLIQAWKDGK